MAIRKIETRPRAQPVAVNWSVVGQLDEQTLGEVRRFLELRGLVVKPHEDKPLGKSALATYDALVEYGDWLTSRKLATITGRNHSSVRVYLTELIRRGMVERMVDDEGAKFKAR